MEPTDRMATHEKALSECLSKPYAELTREELTTCALEREFCKTSLIRFARYAKIVIPPTPKDPGGIVRFELWPHIIEMIKAFLTHNLISILKSRQIGASWTMAFCILWDALFHLGSMSLLFSKGEGEAIELLSKCRRIYSQLPDFLKLKPNPDSATEMSFPTMMSSIRVMAATESAGISFTASNIVADEHEQHPYAAQNYSMAKPVIDAGGKFISIFTVDKSKSSTLAKTLFRDALENKNGFHPIFIPYTARPGRDERWYEETKRSIPVEELGILTPDLYMEQNYPRSIEEALRRTSDISAFDARILDEMMGNTRNPIKEVLPGIDSNVVHIFQPHYIGHHYITGSDTGHGVGKDYSVTPIMCIETGAVVADVFSNKISPEEFAFQSIKLLELYRNPKWYPEDNEWGRVVINTALNLGYKNFGYQDEKKTKIGFHTGQTSRFELWGHLISAINNRQITIYNSQGLKQFYDIIRNVSKEGRIEAATGCNDDYPVAVGICWLKRAEVKTEPWVTKPIASLTFRK